MIHMLNDPDTPAKFVLSIVSHLVPMKAHCNEMIIDVGDISTELFFLSKGTVRLLQPSTKAINEDDVGTAEGIYVKYQEEKRKSLTGFSEDSVSNVEQRRFNWQKQSLGVASRNLSDKDFDDYDDIESHDGLEGKHSSSYDFGLTRQSSSFRADKSPKRSGSLASFSFSFRRPNVLKCLDADSDSGTDAEKKSITDDVGGNQKHDVSDDKTQDQTHVEKKIM